MRPIVLSVQTWNPLKNQYVPLPDGTRVRSLRPGVLVPDELDVGLVRDGRVTVGFEDVNTLCFDADLEGEAIDWSTGERVPHGSFASWTPPSPWPAFLGRRRPRGNEGTEKRPFVVRFGREAFLRFMWWNEAEARFAPAPAGLRVRAWDDDLLRDDVLAEGETDAEGRVSLRLTSGGEPGPELYFTVDPPGAGAPAGFPLNQTWDSRATTPRREAWRPPGQGRMAPETGAFADWTAQRLGRPDQPYVYTLEGDGPRVRAGNRATLLVDGPAALNGWEALIASAQKTLHFQVMLWFNDAQTRRVQAALIAAAKRGVQVRVMFGQDITRKSAAAIDIAKAWARLFQVFTEEEREARLAFLDRGLPAAKDRAAIDALVEELRATPNVTVFDNSFSEVELGPGVKQALPPAYAALEDQLPFFTIARVDHRKLMIADGRAAMIGGHNLGEEYVYPAPFDPQKPDDTEPWVMWHDVSVRLEGPIVADLQRFFRERWVTEGGDRFPETGDGPDHPTFPTLAPISGGASVRVVDTTPGARRNYHSAILRLFDGARKEILILNPYFSNPEVLSALTGAARRGVSVKFVLPDTRSDSLEFVYAARLWYRELLEAGVEVYEYQNHMTHAKVAVVDDVGVVGTANLNHSSLFHHYELAAFVEDAAFAAEMRRQLWDIDIPRSRRIQMEDLGPLCNINSVGKAFVYGVVHQRF